MLGIYPREKHGQAMALWGMGVMIGPIMGPRLGGWLTENFDWRWVFYINLPIGLLAALGIWACMDETPRGERRFDLFADCVGNGIARNVCRESAEIEFSWIVAHVWSSCWLRSPCCLTARSACSGIGQS